METCSLSDWTLDDRREPRIRVGLVLPEDAMPEVSFVLPEDRCRACADGAEVRLAVKAGRVTAEGRRVRLVAGAARVGPAERIVLRTGGDAPLEAGAGVRLTSVVAGRGFHWQTRIEPCFVGDLEFLARDGRLVVVNELPVEDYLTGVISGEMSGECPLEFLKSQCVVARAWVLAHTEPKHPDLPIDRCNDDCCQRYQGTDDLTPTVLEAVRRTRGQVLLDPQGRLIDANYSKNCGGIIEAPEHVWGVAKPGQRAAPDAPPGSPARRFFPVTEENLQEYLTGTWLADTDVFCSPTVVPERDLRRYLGRVDDGGGHFRWRFEYRRQELQDVLRRKLEARLEGGLERLEGLAVLARGCSGRARRLRIDYRDESGAARQLVLESEYAIRDALHEKFLYSSAVAIRTVGDPAGPPEHVILTGAGWGHGAGLCQIGALGMALHGYTCEQIVRHYFEPAELRACY